MNAAHKYDMIDDYEDFYYQDDMDLIKSVHSISLGDIMGEDHDVAIQKNKQFGFDIEIDNDNSQTILREEGIHPYAIKSFALFCKRFLNSYSRQCDKE
ncbi:TPA: hypothetical protein F8R99_14325 [Legionella pneumophila]|nr:hypothetical protein [Legionella pneumophila]